MQCYPPSDNVIRRRQTTKKYVKKLFNPGEWYLFKVHEIKFVLMAAFRDEFRPFVDKVIIKKSSIEAMK